ncbi:MAG: hypothetical protein AAFV49_24035, partial [Pseudomonadota bacterium]
MRGHAPPCGDVGLELGLRLGRCRHKPDGGEDGLGPAVAGPGGTSGRREPIEEALREPPPP